MRFSCTLKCSQQCKSQAAVIQWQQCGLLPSPSPPSTYGHSLAPCSPAFRLIGEGGTKPGQSAHIGSPESACQAQPLTIAPPPPPPTTWPLTPVCQTQPHVDAVPPHRARAHAGGDGWALVFPVSVVWEGAASGHCTPLPCTCCSLCCPRGWFGASSPLGGSLAEEGRLVPGIWPRAGEGAWVSQDQRPQAGREPVLRHLVSHTPSCSELGADSASQDTSLQSACEGGPCRPGPLHPLPLALPGPPQPHPGVLPGPSPGTPCSVTGPDNLVVLAAAGSGLPRRTTRLRAESRWGQGCHRPPQPAPHFFTLVSKATSVAILNVGSQISFREGALSRGTWSPKTWSAQ